MYNLRIIWPVVDVLLDEDWPIRMFCVFIVITYFILHRPKISSYVMFVKMELHLSKVE